MRHDRSFVDTLSIKPRSRSGWTVVLALIAWGFVAPAAQAWEAYGGDAGGSKFSEHAQINKDNIAELKQAWVFQTGETGEGYASGYNITFEATPIYWRDTLFVNSSFGKVYAIDAATGEQKWRFDSGLDPHRRFSETAARGVSLWHGETDNGTCAHRILFGTLEGYLWAVDALTGLACEDFGNAGRVDLTQGVGDVQAGEYTLTSPPALIGDTLFIGSAIGDNRKVESEHGIVRAINVQSGEILWSWDPIPRDLDDPARDGWSGNSADISGGANAWAPLSVDADLNLVYVPTSAPSPDFYGGHRQGDNLYTSSVVALNATSGAVVWHQQLVHHDVWDYDTPAQPVLVELDLGEGPRPALVQVTKTGMIYVFDRRNGTPLIPIEERQVPGEPVPGEQLSPTQPFSTLPPIARHQGISADDAFGIAIFDKMGCKSRIENYRSEGIYTPPSLAGTLMVPGYAGGANWGGIGVDAQNGLAVTFVNELPAVVRLVPRDEFEQNNRPEALDPSAMYGTPYIMERAPFLSAFGLPCTQPPWGRLVAMDLVAKKIAWEVPLGTIADLAPAFVPNFAWGVPGLGGPMITGAGIVFIGAAAEHRFRAFDLHTGQLLWDAPLPRAGIASPMTYVSGGKQYVVIAAGGHAQLTEQTGDYLVAFALPDE